MTLAELSLSGGPLYAILPAALGELWREIRDVADKDYNGHFVKNVFLFLRYLRLTFSNMCDERVFNEKLIS